MPVLNLPGIIIHFQSILLTAREATALNVPMWTLEQAARVWRFAMIQGKGGPERDCDRPRHGILGGRRGSAEDETIVL